MMIHWWYRLQQWWRGWRGGGEMQVGLQLADPEYWRFERACLICGLDPEDFRKGEATLQDADLPSGSDKVQRLFETVCTNPHVVDVEALTPPQRDGLVAHIAGHFFIDALMRFSEQQRAYSSMLNDAEPPTSPTLDRLKRSGAALRVMTRMRGSAS